MLVRNRLQEYSDAFEHYEKHLDEVEKGEDQGKARKRFMAEMAAHLDPNSNGFFDAELVARGAALKRLERDRKWQLISSPTRINTLWRPKKLRHR